MRLDSHRLTQHIVCVYACDVQINVLRIVRGDIKVTAVRVESTAILPVCVHVLLPLRDFAALFFVAN